MTLLRKIYRKMENVLSLSVKSTLKFNPKTQHAMRCVIQIQEPVINQNSILGFIFTEFPRFAFEVVL